MSSPSDLLVQLLHEFRRHKELADQAMCQLDDETFFQRPAPCSGKGPSGNEAPHVNPVALIVKHLAGNLISRWTDFLTTDGEKPSRNRDQEFVISAQDTRASLLVEWERGWRIVTQAIGGLTEADLDRSVTIRGEPHTVIQALLRGMSHAAYHTGQILYLVRLLRPDSPWLTIVPGHSRGQPGEYLSRQEPRAAGTSQPIASVSPYALGTSWRAARRLEIQDSQFAAVSESLLDRLEIRQDDRVVELGCGAGSFSRRVLRRLGPQGRLTGVDYMQSMLDQAVAVLAGASLARFMPLRADIRDTAAWSAGQVDVILGRTVLHHLPLPEAFLGELRTSLPPGTRLGFIEPEFRLLIGRLTRLEQSGRPELAPLRRWADGIGRYYQACGLSPSIGATLGQTLVAAGYRQVESQWSECPLDADGIENMLLYYDEVKDRYLEKGIMQAAEIEEEKRLLAALPEGNLPASWGAFSVTCVAS